MMKEFFVYLSFTVLVAADSYFFVNDTLGPSANPISTKCSSALLASINCAQDFIDLAQQDFYGPMNNLTLQNSVCDPVCGTALTTYRSSVAAACASDPQPFPGLPATYFVDVIHGTYSLSCMKDNTTGQYCTDYFEGVFGNMSEIDNDGTGISATEICSPCIINSFKQMQSTPYSNYDSNLASVWNSIQSTCGLSFDTTVPSIVTNITLSDFAPPGSAYSGGCLSGNFYTVQSGDNCRAISVAHNVATGTLIAVNNILKDCTNIFVGQSLCLPQTCTTYTVQPGDTCTSIAQAHNLLYPEILAYNPTLNAYCTNMGLESLICISPPGGNTWTGTTIPAATITQTAIFATATVPPPANIAHGTTTHCGQYYTVGSGDFCQLIALNFTITLDLFEDINPSINDDCTNLFVGLAYCVFPTADWNDTSSTPPTSTTIAPPTATPSGTTNQCFEWYIVKSGDFCGLIESQFDITFTQFQFWNPSLQMDCSNLFAGEAYCVSGADQPPTATVTAAGVASRRALGVRETGGVPIGWPYPIRHEVPGMARATFL